METVQNLAKVEKEYEKDDKLKAEDVENLKIWAEKQPHLPKMSELQYVLFLQSCYYSNEKAKQAIEIYFTMRSFCKELFKNGDVNDPRVLNALDVAIIYFLPHCDANRHRVVYMKLLNTNVDNFIYADHLRMFDMVTSLYMHLHGTNEGVNLAFDLEGVSFGHLLRMSPVLTHKYLYYMQEGLPIRLKNIYITNAPSWIDKALAFFKPFLKKELYDAIHIYTSFDSFFEVVPREIMPKDYGANNVDYVIDLAEKNKKSFKDNAEFFKIQELQLTDESKREKKLEDYDNMFGMNGTFKKLELD